MFYSERATFEFVNPARYSVSDRLCPLVLQLILQLVDLMIAGFGALGRLDTLGYAWKRLDRDTLG